MKNLKHGIGALAVAGVVAALTVVPTAAFAAPATPTGSDAPVYLQDNSDWVPVSPTAATPVLLDVIGYPTQGDPLSVYTLPTGKHYYAFVSPVGQERDTTKWSVYSDRGFDASASGNTPNLSLNGFNGNSTNTPGNLNDLVAAGGIYSLGIAAVTGTYGIGTPVVNYAAYTQIEITQGTVSTATYTWALPAAPVTAPAITVQPTAQTVLPGTSATFTAAASGSPAPTVQWQSSTNGTTWTDVSGATSATLTVSSVTLAQTGTQYRAVFTNTAGSATTDAVALTVTDTTPTEPTTGNAGQVSITNPAEGDTTITVAAGGSHTNQTLHAWAWSTATDLGAVTTDGSGNATVNISSLAPGTHTVALTLPNSASVIAWGTFDVPVPTYPNQTDTVDLSAQVRASDLWSLNAEQTAVNFGTVQRNATSTQSLGKVTVVDDRNVLKGWDLDAAWTAFTAGSDTIPTSALTLTPKAFTGYTLINGITLGSNGTKIAQSTAGVSTLTSGALFDADLTFKAPQDAKVGDYHSTLTLTLTSK